MENQELFESLVEAYSNKAYAIYSDWSGAVEQEAKRWESALSAQSVFTESEIRAEFTARHNAFVTSLSVA